MRLGYKFSPFHQQNTNTSIELYATVKYALVAVNYRYISGVLSLQNPK
jgi:hypothetical protein